MAVKKTTLGRNLNALLGTLAAPELKVEKKQAGGVLHVAVDKLQRGKYQPRDMIAEHTLQELADSIKAHGIVQPIVVRPVSGDMHEIIAGERRWRAAQIAGLGEVPVIVRSLSDKAAMATALIENIQREDLNPVEAAKALQRLMDEFSLTHAQVAEVVGKSRATVSNLLRLLTVHKTVKEFLEQGKLEMGHARALLALKPVQQAEIGRQIVNKNLSVRDTEKYVRSLLEPKTPTTTTAKKAPLFIKQQLQLADLLQTAVEIKEKIAGKGELVIKYKNKEHLDEILSYFL